MKQNSTNFLMRFFRQVYQELGRVEWPSAHDFYVACVSVLAVVIFVGMYIFFVDKLVRFGFDAIIALFKI